MVWDGILKILKMNDYINPRENYIHPTAQIAPGVILGTGNYIGPFCIIGYPAEHKAFWGKDQKGVIIGDNNVFTGHVTIDSGTEKPTTIGNKCWFLKHSHAGHDAEIGDEVTVSCGAKIGGHSIIHSYSNLGLNSCIHQKVRVPEGTMVGMNAAITKTLQMEPYRKYAGVPAKDIGSNLKVVKTEPGETVGMDTKRQGSLHELARLGQEIENLGFLNDIKNYSSFNVLGESQGKTIFVLKNKKDSPVMIYVPAEGKIYTSGLGLYCADMQTLIFIFKLLGYNI